MRIGNLFGRKRSANEQPSVANQAASFFTDDANEGDAPALLDDGEVGLFTLLRCMEAEALGIFALHGLPTDPGFYRRTPDGDWEFLGSNIAPGEKWRMVLDQPPEEGWSYVRLADIGRRQKPYEREVMVAVRLLEALDLSRRQVDDGAGGIDPARGDTLRAGMNLLRALGDVGRVSGRKLLPLPEDSAVQADTQLFRRTLSEERQWHWRTWQAEADAIWALRPNLSRRLIAERVRRNLGLTESAHSIRRRISRPQPKTLVESAATDEAPR